MSSTDLERLEKDHQTQVMIDDPRSMFLFQWYIEVDKNGKDLPGKYQNKACAGYRLPLDNNGEPWRWISNFQVIVAVALKKHPTLPRRICLADAKGRPKDGIAEIHRHAVGVRCSQWCCHQCRCRCSARSHRSRSCGHDRHCCCRAAPRPLPLLAVGRRAVVVGLLADRARQQRRRHSRWMQPPRPRLPTQRRLPARQRVLSGCASERGCMSRLRARRVRDRGQLARCLRLVWRTIALRHTKSHIKHIH